MASRKIKWSSSAVLSHRSHSTYYSYFTTTSKDGGDVRVYKLGDCVPIKVNRRMSVMLAEIVELSVNEALAADSDEEDSRDKVSIRLYASPQDTPNGRSHNHGEHELMMFYKQVSLSCQQFLSMEQESAVGFTNGVPLQPPLPDPPLPPSPASSSKSATSSVANLLYCYEPMVPIGLFEYEEQAGISPCSSPIANRVTPPNSPSLVHPKIKVVSELAYCRYRAVLARLGGDHAYQYMSMPRVKMLGGLPIPSVNTLMMFCKKTFRDINLERKLDYCISKSVAFSVMKNRRPSSSVSPSPSSAASSDNTTTGVNDLVKSRGHPIGRRRRGRPRKDNYSSPLKRRRNGDNDSGYPSSNKRSSSDEGDVYMDEESPIADVEVGGALYSRKRTNKQHTNSPSKRPKTTKKHIAQPASVINPTDASTILAYPVYNLNPTTVQDGSGDNGGNSQQLLIKDGIVIRNDVVTVCSSSGTSLVDSDVLVHSLRPRSTLLPPPQFRDESYDLQQHHHSPKSSNESSNNELTTSMETSNSISQPHSDHSLTKQSITSPIKPLPTMITPAATQHTTTTDGPLELKKPKLASSSQAEITQDVKELLKAYLSCLQQQAANSATAGDGNESSSQINIINSNLITHLIDERQFLDLLFCFMKRRKTPIHRVPRLGSRNLNLFELYKVTNMLGGYEQVTINRKWSHVFDSLGCAAGMTCASTVTRKHYEKLLLPFERALGAMKK